MDWAVILGKIAAGGWPAWIVSAILGIIGLVLYTKYKQWLNEQALLESEKKKTEDQAKNNTDNQAVSDGWNTASGSLPKTDNKKPRPQPPI